MTSELFTIIRAKHPHWEGLLKLSTADNSITHESHSTKGLYDLTNGQLTVFWEGYPREVFVEVEGIFLHTSLSMDRGDPFAANNSNMQKNNKPEDTASTSKNFVHSKKSKKTAVITDANSADFFFPRWKKYYGDLFGIQNLYVVTYQGKGRELFDDGIINIWELYSVYSNALRAKVIGHLVTTLLNSYDVVLRCDVDEFLVPNPLKFEDLSDYVEKNALPYVTARGVDVVEVSEDKPLEDDKPILGIQRRYGQLSAALNKTCLTTIPLQWGAGFHAASVFPTFSELYNFHLKWANIKGRILWHEKMLEGLAPGSSEHKYFGVGAKHLSEHQNYLASKPRLESHIDEEFDQKFLAKVAFNPATNRYQGEFFVHEMLFRINEGFYKMKNIF